MLKASKRAPFKRQPPYKRWREERKDLKGTVYVSIKLRNVTGKDNRGYEKGNKSHTLSVREAKVSAVAKEIERALFGS